MGRSFWQPMIVGLALALAAGSANAAPAQPGDARALTERAGQLYSTADRMAGSGDRKNAIIFAYRSLKAADEALAAGGDRAQIEPGMRMIQADLGDWLVAEQRWDEARTQFRAIAAPNGGNLTDYFRIRGLKGLIAADAALGDLPAVRSGLADLIATGRAMLAKEPSNAFLTRQLAEFLEADTFLRYWTADAEPPMRAAAMETLSLFRAVAAANPDSGEARRAQFIWAWRNARITNEVPLWREAVDTGTWLEIHHELKKYGQEFAEAKRKMAAYERKGMINLSD
jgi:hypothetical protein